MFSYVSLGLRACQIVDKDKMDQVDNQTILSLLVPNDQRWNARNASIHRLDHLNQILKERFPKLFKLASYRCFQMFDGDHRGCW